MSDNQFDREDEIDERIEEVKALRPEDLGQHFDPKAIAKVNGNRAKAWKKAEGHKRTMVGRLWHPNVAQDVTCGVCKLPMDMQTEMLDVYCNGTSVSALVAKYGVTKRDFRRHARGMKWDYERAKNTDLAWAMLADIGIRNVQANPKEVTPEHLIKILHMIDKREGRIVEKVQVNAAPAITFVVGTPLPPPARNAALIHEDTKAVASGGTLMLPASSVTDVTPTATESASAAQPQGEVIDSATSSTRSE
jgi:hypothetical protein